MGGGGKNLIHTKLRDPKLVTFATLSPFPPTRPILKASMRWKHLDGMATPERMTAISAAMNPPRQRVKYTRL